MKFSAVSAEEAFRLIKYRSPTDPFGYIVTPNVDHVVRINREPEVLGVLYRDAYLTLCDSRILRFLARLRGCDLPLATGSGLVGRLFREGFEDGEALTIIGCEEEKIRKLQALNPKLRILHYNPPMGFYRDRREVEKVLDFIVCHATRIVILAVGSPQQEMVAHEAARRGLERGLCLCAGASVDFVVEPWRRAPVWVQALSLEWLYRMICEPKRLWRRYLVEDMAIFPIFLRSLLRKP